MTYSEIAAEVKRRFGFTPKICWIAHAKESLGLPVRSAWNRRSTDVRQVPCPPDKVQQIAAVMVGSLGKA